MKKSAIVYIIELNNKSGKFEAHPEKYSDLVLSARVMTTTPVGVGPVYFVERVSRPDIFVIKKWGCDGNARTVGTFDTEEEAGDELFDFGEIDLNNSETLYYPSRAEADDALAELNAELNAE